MGNRKKLFSIIQHLYQEKVVKVEIQEWTNLI